MTYKKTKEGIEFERALEIVKKRIEKQLRLNGKLKEGQEFRITIPKDDSFGAIDSDVWTGMECKSIHYFHPNGLFKF